jgi:transcriptional regulator with XRE-family HTH domain
MSTRQKVVRMLREPPAFTVGDRIRMVRRELGMTQGRFAVFIDITKPLLAAYESGIRPVPKDQVWPISNRIEKLTGYPAVWVVTGREGDGDLPDQRGATDPNRASTAYKSHVPPRHTLRLADQAA